MKHLLLYPALMSLVLFFVMGADKAAAKLAARRVQETTLLALAILGGSVGGIAGMLVFHHKTRKPAFSVGLPVILLVQLALVYVLFVR